MEPEDYRLEDEIVVVKEWTVEPIAKVDVNDSTDDTFVILQHLSEISSHGDSGVKEPKPHIGPRPTLMRSKPGIVRESPRLHRLNNLYRRQAAGRIQRWWRGLQARQRCEPISEMRSMVACECGCLLS